MGPNVEAACQFAETSERTAGIGRLEDARAILEGNAGTLIESGQTSAKCPPRTYLGAGPTRRAASWPELDLH